MIRPAADGPEMRFDTDGARLRYRDEGRGSAVILVHGWTLDLDMWEPQAAELASAYRVIRLDRRGFGLSSGNPSLAHDVTDLLALCRHLQIPRAAFVGMSQGARVVLHLAGMAPDLVSCAVLDGAPAVGAASATNRAPDLPYEDYRRIAQARDVAAFRRAWAEHPLMRLRTGDAQARDLLARMIARYPATDLTMPVPSPPLVTTLEMIRSVVAPVLLIGGALDLDSRKSFAQELALELKVAERCEIPGAGHLCNLDNPRAYTAALREFLTRHP